jgi:SAM-dependent methyltransferase
MLKEILDKHGSDKSSKHQYHLVYENEFKKFRNEKINLLEIGILGGSSLKTWLDYFPNANIYAIDILDKNQVEVLGNSRISYLQHDSTNKNLTNEVKKWNVEFDIIIEDGLHTPDANQQTFENLIDFLKPNGSYYIEDFFPMHLMNENDFSTDSGKWLLKNKHWSVEKVEKFLSSIVKFNFEVFDNRHLTNEQDSFIIKIKK